MTAACKVGIETFNTTFEFWMCRSSRCINQDSTLINVTSPEWTQYNSTLCAAAESCKKVCEISGEFLSCVTKTFCEGANSTVKAVAETVYTIHKETDQATAAAMLPVALVVSAAGFGTSVIIDRCAPKNRVFSVLSTVSAYVGMVGGLGAAYYGSRLS